MELHSASDLIAQRAIEGERIEYKTGVDDQTLPAIVRTVCAFANDLYELNGGYILIGVSDDRGRPGEIVGVPNELLEAWQQKIRQTCASNIKPSYAPRVVVDSYQGKALLLVRVYPGPERPYAAPSRRKDDLRPFVRQGAESVIAFGPLIGAMLAGSKPVNVYHYQVDSGRSIMAYRLDRRFLIGDDS